MREDFIVNTRAHSVGKENRSEMVMMNNYQSNPDFKWTYDLQYTTFMLNEENSKRQIRLRSGQDELEFKRVETNYENQYLEVAEYNYSANISNVVALLWNDDNQEIQIFVDVMCKKDLDESDCDKGHEESRAEIIETLKTARLLDKGV